MITQENISSHELIGLRARISNSSNLQVMGVEGKVVDETKFTFVLDTGNGLKRFPKAKTEWRFSFGQNSAEIDGTKLTRRSYERVGMKA